MSITALALVAPGDIITSAQQNIVRSNFDVLDARTGGDPGASGKFLVASGAAAAAWTAALTAILTGLGYTPANKAGESFGGDIIAPNITATAIINAAQYIGGSVLAGVPSVLGLNVGTSGFAVAGPFNSSAFVNPSEYRGGSTASGVPSVLGLNVGTSGIVITGGPLSGVTAHFTSQITADGQIVLTLNNGVTPVFSIDAAQANVTVPNLKSAKATTADGVVAGSITDTSVAAANKDGAVGTYSMRTIGTGAQQAAAGNHSHAAGTQIASGSYSGTGSSKTVTGLGFTPKAVLITASNSTGGVGTGSIVMVARNASSTATSALTLSSGQFIVDSTLSTLGVTYDWVALG